MLPSETELPIIQKNYDAILWFMPFLNRLPRDHKFIFDCIFSGANLRDTENVSLLKEVMA